MGGPFTRLMCDIMRETLTFPVGNAQMFGALSIHPELHEKLHMLIAIAPAACIRPKCGFVLKTMYGFTSVSGSLTLMS